MATPKVPSVPTVPPSTSQDMQPFLIAVKEILDSMRNSDGTYGSATSGEISALEEQIASAESATSTGNSTNSSNTVPPEVIDPLFPPSSTPPAITGLAVSPGFSTILLSWDSLAYGYAAYTNIYRAAVDDFSVATVVGSATALVYADYVPNSTAYYYWVTSVSKYGVEGPANLVAGTQATVSFDPTYTKLVLQNAITVNEVAVGETGLLNSSQLWGDIGGAGKPADNATVGATWGVDITGQPSGFVQTFYEPTEPTGAATGDFWIDSDNNELYRYDGASWVSVQDDQIALAVTQAATAQATADGKVKTFAQATPPTADGVGDLWMETDADNKLHRWNGSSWEELVQDSADWAKVFGTGKPADNATVGATLGVDVGGQITPANIATLMAAETIPTSRIALAAINSALIANGVITEAHIGTAVILNAFIQNLGADRLSVTNLAALSADMGNLTAGTIKSPDNTFIIDLTTKQILITGAAGQAADNYTVIQNGEISSYTWNGSTHTLSKALRGIATGTAANGDTVTINSVSFPVQPSITVTPRDILVYDQTQSSVSQRLQIRADNIQETTPGSGTWQFDAIAEITAADGSDNVVVNDIQGPNSTATHTTSVYTTTSNVTDISVSLTLQSSLGKNATASNFNYYYRTATVTLYHRAAGGGAYTATATQVKEIGATRGDVVATMDFTGLTSQAHDFYLTVEYANLNTTTFSEPTGGYDYASTTVNPTNVTANAAPGTHDSGGGDSDTGTASISISANVPSGYTTGDIYNVTYNWDTKYSYNIRWASTNATVTDANGLVVNHSIGSSDFSNAYESATDVVVSGRSTTGSSYATTLLIETVSVTANHDYFGHTAQSDGTASATAQNVSVTHDYRKVKTISTTAVNKVTFIDYTATVTGGSTINTGTLNWQAIGE